MKGYYNNLLAESSNGDSKISGSSAKNDADDGPKIPAESMPEKWKGQIEKVTLHMESSFLVFNMLKNPGIIY